jgi:hypothetical protein
LYVETKYQERNEAIMFTIQSYTLIVSNVKEKDPILDESKRFSKGYRNVIVLKKLTFPNDKILSIEISEKQISGRNITLNIDYEDVLYADSFHSTLLQED